MTAADIFLGLIAIMFPPLAVWIKRGICSFDSLINILLCVLGYIPGLIHAWYIISLYPEADYDYEPINDPERGDGTVTRYYVVGGGNGSGRPPRGNQQQQQRAYGTQAPGQAPPNVPNDTRPAAQFPGSAAAGEGSAARPPPTYAEAVQGDHKVQTRG